MRVKQLIRRAIQIIKTKPGFIRELFYILQYDNLKGVAAHINAISFEQIDENNYFCVDELRGNGVANSFTNMIRCGQYCLGAFVDGKLIGHAVLIPPSANHNQVFVRQGGFIHFCYVAPSFRGKCIYPNMLYELVKRAHLLFGLDKFMISTAPDNLASQRGLQKVGFTFYADKRSIVWWRVVIGKVRI